MDWSGVDYLWIIVMFLSAVWTLILTAPIHCRGSIGETLMQCYISPNLMKKQTHLHLEWPCTIGLEHSDFRLLELFVIAKWHTSALNIVCTKVKYPNNFVIKRKIMWSHSYRHKLPSRWILCQINTSVGSRPHTDTQHNTSRANASQKPAWGLLSNVWAQTELIQIQYLRSEGLKAGFISYHKCLLPFQRYPVLFITMSFGICQCHYHHIGKWGEMGNHSNENALQMHYTSKVWTHLLILYYHYYFLRSPRRHLFDQKYY